MKSKIALIFLLILISNPLLSTEESQHVISPKPTYSPMVLVPASDFIMGNNNGSSDEGPEHKVYLNAFYIDKYAVTNKDYQKFTRATGYPEPLFWRKDEYKSSNEPDKPVIGISWFDAAKYAEWAGKRLPTEAEWEKAARGVDGYLYPWGDDKPNKELCNAGSGYTINVNLLEKGASPFGAFNMIGNVWEWCNDWYDEDYYKVSIYQNPPGPKSTDRKVLRGGSFLCSPDILRVTIKSYAPPNEKALYYGFRCVKDVK